MSLKPGVILGIVVVGLAALLILSNGTPTTPEGFPLVDNVNTYKQQIIEANDKVKPLIIKAESGDDLTDQDVATLIESGKKLDNANRFQPNRVVPFLYAGKAYQFANLPELAEERYKQCLANLPYQPKDVDPKILQTGYEAHYRLSEILFNRGDYKTSLDEAMKAMTGEPESPDYLAATANALIQLKREPEASVLLTKSLTLAPKHRMSVGLAKMLGMAVPK
ncbi:hypothetical protein BH11ARM1_BH11ARM1_04870 [soil metagenome]